ncbi:Monocarboxylate transporter [Ooceraea biroi]|uniref:Monocarboxylate transporter n=1 Tax=Ooceraea biroi TaxID=2015173 RepID=A0A026WK44_OOCBI|nr:Monocarboxylate transporter [Ooceraea biroi]
MEVATEDDEITLEDLAPDGGWGWIIALATILVFISTISPTTSFAIIFGDFIEASGQAGMANSLFNSVFMITYSLASLLTNTLLKRYSARSVGIMGALLFSIPDIVLAFVRNIYDMAFLFFIQGFGTGLFFTICNTIFNAYFVKKRAKVMSASQVIISLGGIVYPSLTEKMMTMYGFRGTAAIMGAISLNSIVGMSVMHPVEWHAKKPEEVRAERARKKERKFQQQLTLSNRRSTIGANHVSSKARWSSLRSLKEENGTDVSLLLETVKPTAYRVASISAIEDEIHERTRSESIQKNLTRRMSVVSASSLVNLATSVALSDIHQHHLHEKQHKERQVDKEIQEKEEKQDNEEKQEQEEEKGYKTVLRELLDMSLIKNLGFLNLCFGISFVCTSDYGFSSLLPLMMSDAGYTKGDAALAITISGIAELVSRVLLTMFTLIVDVKAKYLFFGAMIFMGFARTGEYSYV